VPSQLLFYLFLIIVFLGALLAVGQMLKELLRFFLQLISAGKMDPMALTIVGLPLALVAIIYLKEDILARLFGVESHGFLVFAIPVLVFAAVILWIYLSSIKKK
jgi:hypothetical protein